MTKQARNYRRAKRATDNKLKPIMAAIEMAERNYRDGFITASELLQELKRIENEIKAV